MMELEKIWREKISEAVRSADELETFLTLSDEEKEEIDEVNKVFKMCITQYYLSLIDHEDVNCPIRKQCVPSKAELQVSEADLEDPLAESKNSPVPGLIHRYPDRVLFLITNQCAMYCRHCTRRRLVGNKDDIISKEQIDEGIKYISKTKKINDVLLSGGDALMVSDERLEYIISELRKIAHVSVIRIGSRMPVVAPYRITDDLCNMLKKYHPIWLNTQFNHVKEITPESTEACRKLIEAGIPVGNQSVLLRGVNDTVKDIKDLLYGLIKIRVRPYYLYQCDLSMGIEHFRTPVAKGIEIMENLRGHISGYAVPTFVIDAPGGGGKIPISPQYVISQTPNKYILRNYENRILTYTEPIFFNAENQE
ncbi:MAG TPA: lysine 2,3-aminomutase [Clostridiaceae bacterium]|nr:lysine 2,3-aminomutase [Clostridiaceae bacterium]